MKKLLLFCWLASLPAFGQAYSSSVTQNSPGNYGRPVPFAQVQVCTVLDNAVPCVSKVSTYVDQTLAVLCSQTSGSGVLGGGPSSGGHCNNPGIADANGNFTLFLQPGQYTICTNASTWLCQKVSVAGSGVQSSPIVLANCTAAGTTLNEGVNLSTQVIAGVPTLCGTTATANSTAVVGICASACGNSGSASVAYSGYQSCVLDNQSTQNDYVVPSSNPGQCHDIGASTSSANETLGIAASTNTGAGTLATILLAPLSLILPGSTGGAGTVSSCGSGVGANAYYPGIGTVVSCDPLITDDGAGHGSMRSLALTDSTVSGNWFDVAGPALPAIASIPIHSFAFSVNPSFGTSYGLEPWDNAPVNGNCISAVTGDATNYFKLHDTGAPCGTGSGVTLQTNGAPNTSQLLLNFSNTPTITPSNPSGGVEQFSLAGSTQISTPSAPVLTTNGSAGVISYTYGVVGCEDPACVYHTALSATATIATGNATLTNSNSINLKTYGDTLYGVRGFLICRTASAGTPATVGVITNSLLAGKQFIDTGLAGDGTNCASVYASNTTTLQQVCLGSALPGVASPPGAPCGVDAPPATPNALDDEFGPTFGAPGDVNNPVWGWVNQGGASAAWSGGTLLFTLDAAGSSNYRILQQPLPATPYTFVMYVDTHLLFNFDSCGMYQRESSTGKAADFVIQDNQTVNNAAANGGFFLISHHWSNSTTRTDSKFINYINFSAVYLKIQNTGTTLNYSYSLDGVGYEPFLSEAVTAPFTTAPNQIGIGGDANSATGTSLCVVDFFRRTQ